MINNPVVNSVVVVVDDMSLEIFMKILMIIKS